MAMPVTRPPPSSFASAPASGVRLGFVRRGGRFLRFHPPEPARTRHWPSPGPHCSPWAPPTAWSSAATARRGHRRGHSRSVQAAGASSGTVGYDLGGARYLRDGVVLAGSSGWRGLNALLVSGGHQGAASRDRAGLLLNALRPRPHHIQPAALPARQRRSTSSSSRRGTGAATPAKGWLLRKGTPNEVHPGSVNTRPRRRAGRALRSSWPPAACQHLTLVHKTNVSPSPATCGSAPSTSGPGFPRGHRLNWSRRRRLHLLRRGPAALRRDRHRQPLRRHPHRPRRRVRRHRLRRLRNLRPQPHRPRRCSSRSTARLRHRRPGQGPPTPSPPSSRRGDDVD